jgi:pimeloyl-ACP methyl ester carboxylesterase
MAVIEIRGVPHYYEWIGRSPVDSHGTGAPSGGGKPIMVFVHGWAGSLRYWRSTAEALGDEFDCLLYDMRGFGRSRLPKPPIAAFSDLGYELETYADDLALLLDALGLPQVHINAHSMGASVATFFLNRYAERVNTAILTCSGIFEYDERAFKAFYRFGGYVVAFRPPWLSKLPYVNRLFMARFLRRSLPDADSTAFLEDFLEADYEAAMGTIFTSVSQKATEVMPQEFARITVPTLLVSGEYDRIIPAAMGAQAAQLNPQVQHVVIPDTAHFPMLEDAPTYLQTVRAFLATAAQDQLSVD